jgi:hypothetical protein
MTEEQKTKLMERIGSGREYRRTNMFEIREDPQNEEKGKLVHGYATTFGEEYLLWDMGNYRVLEQIDRHAFDACDMSDVIMQYDHEGRVFARNSNGTLRLHVDDHGLGIIADLSGTKAGQELYEEIRGGYTTRMSFGFRVAEDERTVVEDHENHVITVHRTITKISKLYDVSAVSLPANDGTEISARSWSEGVIGELEAERLRAEERARRVRAMKLKLEVKTCEN